MLFKYATLEYKIKDVALQEVGEPKTIFLIASYYHNKNNDRNGFILYSTSDMESWDIRQAAPLVNTILFETAEEAFSIGEKIVRDNNKIHLQILN